ncbi:MAG: hypothetical protein LT080_10350 [Thiobacillus sp.]|nr:hypothetical protein [Thiobacillus sp.]
MPTSIVAYRKASDQYSTYQLDAVDATELCAIDGVTYVAVPDAAALPPQSAQIAASVAVVVPDAVLAAAIKAASPHVQLIDQRMREMIRESYDLETELKYARFGVGAAMGMYSPSIDEIQEITVYGEFVESVRQWGRAERAKLGLI